VADLPGQRWLDQEASSRLARQTLVARSAMEGSVSGHHKSPHKGSSVEFAEYRNYAPGDDIRRLDWRVFARTDRFYMKEFEADTNLRCYLVVDCSASMAFTGEHGPRIDLARRLTALLANILIQQGDAVGLSILGEEGLVEVPAKRNPSHLQLILEKLEHARPARGTVLAEKLHLLADQIRRRALVVIISDFFCEVPELMSCFQHLKFQKHDVSVFHLLDPMELDFQFDRPVRFQDMETGHNMVTEPSLIREEYLKQLRGYLDEISLGCRQFHIDYRRLLVGESHERALADFLIERAQARQ